jgi:hypothetical protein
VQFDRYLDASLFEDLKAQEDAFCIVSKGNVPYSPVGSTLLYAHGTGISVLSFHMPNSILVAGEYHAVVRAKYIRDWYGNYMDRDYTGGSFFLDDNATCAVTIAESEYTEFRVEETGPSLSFATWLSQINTLKSEYDALTTAVTSLAYSPAASTAASYARDVFAASNTIAIIGEKVIVKHKAYMPVPDWSLPPTVANIYPTSGGSIAANPLMAQVQFNKALVTSTVVGSVITAISTVGSIYISSITSIANGPNSCWVYATFHSLAVGGYYHLKIESDNILDYFGNYMAQDYVQAGSWYKVA